MKKRRFIPVLGAIALTFLVPFAITSCSEEEIKDAVSDIQNSVGAGETTPTNQMVITGARTLEIGESVTLKVSFSQSEEAVSWASFNQNVASVDPQGVVTAHSAGEATIVAQGTRDPNLRAEVTIHVNEDSSVEILYVKATFVDYDGRELASDIVEVGDVPVYPYGNPTRLSDGNNSYTFVGWDKEIIGIKEDTVYTAQYEATPLSDFYFSVDVVNGGYEISGYAGSNTDIVIPSSYNYRKVVSIGDQAFRNMAIRSVTIPDTVVHIGEQAFYNCQLLEKIEMPNSVKSLGEQAFYYCASLDAYLEFSDELEEIPDQAFYYCYEVKGVIARGVKRIGDSAFANCYLLDFDFPEGLESIDRFAFQWNRVLRNVVLPDSLTTLGESVFCHSEGILTVTIGAGLETIDAGSGQSLFLGCTNLQTIEVSEDNEHFQAVDDILYSKDGTILYAIALNRAGAIDIIDGCTTIKSNAFYEANGSTLTVPNTVKTVEGYAFWLSNIETVIFEEVDPSDTTQMTLGTYIFWQSKTKEIYLNDGFRTIPNNFARNSEILRKVEMSDNVTAINTYAFGYCYWLDDINIPSHLTTIGTYAFYQTSIEGSITIPAAVTTIPLSAFSGCTNITEINFEEGTKVTSFAGFAFSESGIYNFVMPDTVTSLSGQSHFRYCDNLKSITLSKNLKTLTSYTLADCPNLTTITFGPGEENSSSTWSMTVNANAFRNSTNISTLNFMGTEAQFNNFVSKNTTNLKDLVAGVNAGLITVNYEYGFTPAPEPEPEPEPDTGTDTGTEGDTSGRTEGEGTTTDPVTTPEDGTTGA